MSCFSPAVHDLFDRWEERDLLGRLEASHLQLLDRRKDCIVFGNPDALTPVKRASLNCQVVQQALLHRAERLLASSGVMLVESNVYGLALIVRGHYECTAVLGYFCSRLEALAAKNISFEDFEWNVADAVMGAKHQQFSKARPPLNILTCIEKADKYIDKNLFGAKQGMLRDSYDWLSEFAHPNFLSNVSALSLDKQNNRVVLRHGADLTKEDFQLLGYLEISCELFVTLFDAFSKSAAAEGLEDQV